MDNVKILAEFTVSEENIMLAKNLFNELKEETLLEKDCLSYQVYQDFNKENCFILIEVFKNQEAFNFHKTTKGYLDILKTKIEPLITNKLVRFLK